jgi:hypothetical protein
MLTTRIININHDLVGNYWEYIVVMVENGKPLWNDKMRVCSSWELSDIEIENLIFEEFDFEKRINQEEK